MAQQHWHPCSRLWVRTHDDEPRAALAPENAFLAYFMVPEDRCEGRTFYIFITLSFRFRPLSYCLVFFLLFLYILQLTITLYQYHHLNRARSRRFRPLAARRSFVSAPRLVFAPVFCVLAPVFRPPTRLAPVFSPRNSPLPPASILSVGIHTKPRSQHRAVSRTSTRRVLFVLGTASAA